MSFLSVALPPGVVQMGAASQAAGRFSDSQFIGWTPEGLLRPMGGWQLHSTSAQALLGLPRAIGAWKDNGNGRWIAVGTHKRLYAMTENGTVADITPSRRFVTLGSNPIATTSGSNTITVTDNAHGALAGAVVHLSGATATGGLTTGQLNAELTTVSVTTNTWTAVVSGAAATSAVSGGGAAVVAGYNILDGRADATANTGFGAGPFGAGAFGAARPDTGSKLQPTVWSFGYFGQYLDAVSDSEGTVWQWTLDPSARAVAVPNCPTGVSALVITPEHFLMLLKGRTVQWSDQGDNTVWTASASNQAGDLDLQSSGVLQCGQAMKGQTLLLTTVDAWSCVYQGAPYIYGLTRVGQGCGAISRQCMIVNDTEAVWMGLGDFFAYDGSVQAIPCEVRDAVFGNINLVQKAKVTAVHLSRTREVIWFYPSAGSNEIDRYVKLNYGLLASGVNCWDTGALVRTCGVGPGAFDMPLMVSADGYVYEHETGFNYDGDKPRATTGPIQLGNGERMMEVQGLIPDEKTAGDVQVRFYAKGYPNSPEVTEGPYSLTSPTDFMWQADSVRMTYEGVRLTDWRIGTFQLDVVSGDPMR